MFDMLFLRSGTFSFSLMFGCSGPRAHGRLADSKVAVPQQSLRYG